MCMQGEHPDWTSVHQSGTYPLHRVASVNRVFEGFGIPRSTHSAIRDPAQNILNSASSKLGIDALERNLTAQRPVGTLQPLRRSRIIAQVMLGQGNNPREPI